MASTVEVPSTAADENTPDVAIPAAVDGRPRSRRLLSPLATAVGSAAALTYVAAVDPSTPGHYPLCPTQTFLGVDCPGCGMIRGTHELLGGDLPRAFDHNLLLVVLAPLSVFLLINWIRRAWTGRHPSVTVRQMKWRTGALVASLVGLGIFAVVRNLVPYLGSGVG